MQAIRKHRVLVVDDLLDNLLLLQTFLEMEGYETELANSGTSALSRVRASPPDLILLDVMMPDINGYEVARRIRQDEEACDIPILLITAYYEVSLKEGLEAGANDFIRKPIDFDELLTRIKTFCA